jgi:tetratricopeptide (TPR) repeat protein
LLRSKRPDKDASARDALAELPVVYPNSAWTPRGLLLKATLEERGKVFIADPQLNTSVPAALVTLRLMTDRYSDAEGAEAAFAKLADMYDELKRYDYAAATWEKLATKFPASTRDAWWKAAELYEKRMKDLPRAREAYARVPESSSHYKDAQKRAR